VAIGHQEEKEVVAEGINNGVYTRKRNKSLY